MEESEGSIITLLLSWLLIYGSYAVLSVAVIHCFAVIAATFIFSAGSMDVPFLSSLSFLGPRPSGSPVSQQDLMDVFVFSFTITTILAELGGFLARKFMKKGISLKFMQKFYIGSAIITVITMIGILAAYAAEGFSQGFWITALMFILGMVMSVGSLMLFLALRYLSRIVMQS